MDHACTTSVIDSQFKRLCAGIAPATLSSTIFPLFPPISGTPIQPTPTGISRIAQN